MKKSLDESLPDTNTASFSTIQLHYNNNTKLGPTDHGTIFL